MPRHTRAIIRSAAGTDRPPGTGLSQGTSERFQSTRILFVSAVDEDQVALREILGGQHHSVAVGTVRQALEKLSGDGISIVFCDRDLPDGTWKDIRDRMVASTDSALLVVTCRLADERLWAEVLNLGGFDVLIKPFNVSELKYVVNAASFYLDEPLPPLV